MRDVFLGNEWLEEYVSTVEKIKDIEEDIQKSLALNTEDQAKLAKKEKERLSTRLENLFPSPVRCLSEIVFYYAIELSRIDFSREGIKQIVRTHVEYYLQSPQLFIQLSLKSRIYENMQFLQILIFGFLPVPYYTFMSSLTGVNIPIFRVFCPQNANILENISCLYQSIYIGSIHSIFFAYFIYSFLAFDVSEFIIDTPEPYNQEAGNDSGGLVDIFLLILGTILALLGKISKYLGLLVLVIYLCFLIYGIKDYPYWSSLQFYALIGSPYIFAASASCGILTLVACSIYYFVYIRRLIGYRSYEYTENKIVVFVAFLIISSKYSWSSFSGRYSLLEKITKVAYFIGVEYPASFGIQDAIVLNKFSAIGNYIYNFRNWIIFPRKDTQQYFSSEMSRVLEMILQNNWDELSKLSIDSYFDLKILKRKQRTQNLINICKKILVASTPLLTVIILRIFLENFLEIDFDIAFDVLLISTGLYFIIQVLFLANQDFDKDIEKTKSAVDALKGLISLPLSK